MNDQCTPSKTFDAYRIIRPEIARGGMGVVHEALSPEGARVAIKVLNHAKIEGKEREGLREKYANLFKEEYQTLAGLKHPNIARVHKIGFFEGQLYIVQEFIEGKPLAEYVRGWKPIDMIPLFVQALEGLDFIHRSGLVHLDIKSENILVTTSGAGRRAQSLGPKDLDKSSSPKPNAPSPAPEVKIIDFGLAIAPSEYTGSFMGSVSTMAPEVVLGNKGEVDASADLFSFACVMYQCITCGDMPFARSRVMAREAICRTIERERLPRPPSESHREHPERICEFLDKIILHLLAKDPKDRFYGNARAVINAMATKTPEVFAGTPDSRAAYLMPRDNAHIGRNEEQERLFTSVKALFSGESSFYIIRGLAGMGKTHLMQKVKESAEKRVDEIFISSIAFPANETSVESWNRDLMKYVDENSKPIVIFADDVHEASESAAEVIRGIAQRIADRAKDPDIYRETRPVMLCMAMQHPAETFTLLEKPCIEIIELTSFVESDIKAYLQTTPALKGRDVPKKWVEAIHKTTQGIPREVADYLRELDSKGVIFGPEGSLFVTGGEIKHDLPPSSTRERLWQIYKSLPATERVILDFLAVWNLKGMTRRVTHDDLTNFFYSTSLSQSIRDMVSREILRKEDDCIVWINDYFPEIVYESIPEADRQAVHDSIAKYLKTDREAVAFHRAFGSDRKNAIKYSIILAKKNISTGQKMRTAHELIERAQRLTSSENVKLRAYLTCLVIECHYRIGRHQSAERAFHDGMQLLGTSGAATKNKTWECMLLLRIAALYIQQKRHDDAQNAIERGLSLQRMGSSSPLAIMFLNHKGRDYFEQYIEKSSGGNEPLWQAKDIYEKSEKLAKQLPQNAADRISGNHLGIVLRMLGKYKEAVVILEDAINRKGTNVLSSMTIMLALIETYRQIYKYEMAVSLGKRLCSLARDIGEAKWLLYSHEALANVFHDMDRFDESLEECTKAISAGACLEHDAEQKNAMIRLWILSGHIYKEMRSWEMAKICFMAAISGGGTGPYLLSAYVGLAEIEFGNGTTEDSLNPLEKAENLLKEQPTDAMKPYGFRITVLRIERLLRKGDTEEAKKFVPDLINFATGNTLLEKECEAIKARFPV